MIGIGVGIPTVSVLGGGVPGEPNPNLLLWSEQFDNAVWTKTNITITADQTNDPNSDLTADLLSVTSIGGTVTQDTPDTIEGVTLYTFSLYTKQNLSSEDIAIQLLDDSGLLDSKLFAPQVEWFRVSVSGTTSAAPTFLQVRIFPQSEDSAFIWGAKLELGNLTSYVKREGV